MHESARPRFVARVEEWNELYPNLPGSATVLWADTENALTDVRMNAGSVHSRIAEMTTALTILRKTPGDRKADAFHTVLDTCEGILWDCLRRIEALSDRNNNGPCSDAVHIDLSSVKVMREGPYTNEWYAVTATFDLKLRNAIPVYDLNKWTS